MWIAQVGTTNISEIYPLRTMNGWIHLKAAEILQSALKWWTD